MLLAPGFPLVAVAPEADHVINTSATLVAGAVAALAWIRFRETGLTDALLQASAFAVLFVGGAISVLLLLTGADAAAGFSRDAPGQAPLYIWTLQRLLAGGLLLTGAYLAHSRRPGPERSRALLIALVPGGVLLLLVVVILLATDRLPALVPQQILAAVTTRLESFDTSLVSPTMLVVQLGVGLLFVAAAVGYAWLYGRRPETRPYSAYLAVALVIGAFSQLHFAIVPGAYSELVAAGDVLRVVFYFVVAVGVAAAARQDLRDLRLANRRLHELRESDARRIQLEERARLARDIHDGLVQELWLARLTHGRLNELDGLDAEGRQVVGRLDSILENALAEARQAVVVLQPRDDESFGSLLVRFVEDYSDRFGLEAECSADGETPDLPVHTQAEVLRICREALNNARKHADASLVRVRLSSDSGQLTLSVTDNGAGFDAAASPRRSGFGMRSMRERAQALGAQLEVRSAPMEGTSVTLTLPLNAAPE